jgi:hypothetical protein
VVNRRTLAMLLLAPVACKDEDASAPAAVDDTTAGDTTGTTTSAGDGADDGSTSDGEPFDEGEPLAPTAVLTRASLDLRGVRPSLAELEAVVADPAAVDAMIEGFVDDPSFGLRVRDIFAGAWRTRIDQYPTLDGMYFGDFSESTHEAIGDEPLNLVAWVAMNDRPFTEILTTDMTVVDPALLDGWPLEPIVDEDDSWLPPGTVRARYVDGRPAAGVLSLNSVYWRHPSTVDNANRGRANALSQALLCQSYLDRPIDFPTDLDLTDSASIRDAIRTNGACQACHSTLDPFASFLWGFMYPNDLAKPVYSPANEHDWAIYTDAPPGYYGQPGERMTDLGRMIAEDERFVSCTVRRMYEGLMGREAVLADEGALAEHREEFLAADLSLKALARSIVGDPSYRGARWEPRFGGLPEPVLRKVAPVDVLGRSLGALTGYEMRLGGRSATRLDLALRRLAGGSDRGDSLGVSTGAVLVQRRLAEAGAVFLVDASNAGEIGDGRLAATLADVDLDAEPSSATIAALVIEARSTSLDDEDPELLALGTLWRDVASVTNPREAWIALLTAVLADPDHIIY